ncbi:uncharacterized protein LOC144904445 [Branchiostoma floridae x Branchiostoma belcheri]
MSQTPWRVDMSVGSQSTCVQNLQTLRKTLDLQTCVELSGAIFAPVEPHTRPNEENANKEIKMLGSVSALTTCQVWPEIQFLNNLLLGGHPRKVDSVLLVKTP